MTTIGDDIICKTINGKVLGNNEGHQNLEDVMNNGNVVPAGVNLDMNGMAITKCDSIDTDVRRVTAFPYNVPIGTTPTTLLLNTVNNPYNLNITFPFESITNPYTQTLTIVFETSFQFNEYIMHWNVVTDGVALSAFDADKFIYQTGQFYVFVDSSGGNILHVKRVGDATQSATVEKTHLFITIFPNKT